MIDNIHNVDNGGRRGSDLRGVVSIEHSSMVRVIKLITVVHCLQLIDMFFVKLFCRIWMMVGGVYEERVIRRCERVYRNPLSRTPVAKPTLHNTDGFAPMRFSGSSCCLWLHGLGAL